MQGQRNSFESIPEPLQFDCESNPNSSDMDQSFYQSNLLLNSVETPTLANFLLSPNEANMDYMAMSPQETDVLGIWNSRDYPNTSAFVSNQESHGETIMAHAWSTLSINSGGSPRIEEGHCQRTNIPSLENVDLNLNNTPVDDGQAFTQSLNLSHVSQSAEHNVLPDPHADNVEASLCPFMPEFFEPAHASYINFNGCSSSGVEQVSDDRGSARNSVEGRHIASKRKNRERVFAESSTSHNISADLSIPSSSRYPPAVSSLGENQSPSFSSMHRRVSSECYPPSGLSGNAETSQRNLRARLERQHDISPPSHSGVSSNRISSTRSPGEQSSVLNPFIHSTEQNQPHMLPLPGLPHHVHYSPGSSRFVSSSIPALLQRRMRLIPSHEETNNRSLPIIGVANHPTSHASTSVNHLVQDLPNWNPSNSCLSTLGNRVSTGSDFISLAGSIREPSEMVPVQYRNLAEIVRSSLFPCGGSESGRQSSTLSSRHSGRSASTVEPGQSSRAVCQDHSLPYPMTAVSTDRQHSLSALPLSARSRDGRSRMISEIRNALDLMRQGTNLRFEDVFILDQSGFYGRADLDRHRDMRLDVDNMSYEELLALEERIGYVNTGLSEKTILNCLKQCRYSPSLLEVPAELEPCCICREYYIKGEEVGSLNCGHDFHTACIKQWLMMKNSCPICKTTALVEGNSTISDVTK